MDDGAVVNAHEIHESRLGVTHKPIHLHVRYGRVDDGALGLEFVNGLKLQLEPLSFFKAQVGGGGVHGVLQGGFHLTEVAF